MAGRATIAIGPTRIKGATGRFDNTIVTLITGNPELTVPEKIGSAGAEAAAGSKASTARRSRGAVTRRRTRPRPAAPEQQAPAVIIPASQADRSTPPAGAATSADPHPPRVIFLDIPMTAGPARRAVVKRQFAPGEVLSVYRPLMEDTLRELRSLDEGRKRRSKFVLGHVSFGVHELLPDASECKYVTVLRDPVERVIDEYEYIRRTKQHFLHEPVSRMSLKDFARAGLSNGTHNGQTKYLTQTQWSSLPGRDAGAAAGAGAGVGAGAGAVSTLASGALEQAKRNLEQHFLVVGLTEELDATLLMMKRRLGWKLPFYTGAAPAAPVQSLRATVSPDALAAIEKHNELDLQLYEWSRERFEQSVQRTGLLFQAELRGFQALNAWYAFHRRGGR
jgi:hypothetical protein